MGQSRPFAFVGPRASFTLTSRPPPRVVALRPTDGASYDIPNSPVLELARWLGLRHRKARTPTSTSAADTRLMQAMLGAARAKRTATIFQNFFLKNPAKGRTRCAPPGPRDVRAEGWSRTAPISGRRAAVATARGNRPRDLAASRDVQRENRMVKDPRRFAGRDSWPRRGVSLRMGDLEDIRGWSMVFK